MEYLGRTIGEIASEKARIIKRGVPSITGARGRALSVISEYAAKLKSPLRVYGRDFSSRGDSTDDFHYSGSDWKLRGLRSNLKGLYQIENLSLAIAALEALYEYHGADVREKSLRRGLLGIDWRGRLEVLRKDPPLILDSAHNPAGAKALVASLKGLYPSLRFTFLIGMLADKDHNSFIRELAPIAGKFVITEIESERAIGAEALAKKLSRIFPGDVRIEKNYRKAYADLLKQREPACIAGSLYLTGAIEAVRGS
jgi:dihydrofolate synthase/folylpolyglutamate synthase